MRTTNRQGAPTAALSDFCPPSSSRVGFGAWGPVRGEDVHVTASNTIQSPAELIVDTRGIQTLVVNQRHCDQILARRLAQLLRPFNTAEAVERELSMKKYTYEQAAGMLDTSVKWLQRRVSRNLIPHVTDGHRTWFELDDIRKIQHAQHTGDLDSLKGGGRRTSRPESDQ
jgi:hypothetical protein